MKKAIIDNEGGRGGQKQAGKKTETGRAKERGRELDKQEDRQADRYLKRLMHKR